ncbi:MAG: adenylate/guanylate cyclase domain-containing protein [Desulfobacterales bacterium]
MAIFKLIRTAFWAIGNIGITKDTPPTEKKHISFLNIGILFFGLVCLAWFLGNLTNEKVAPIESTVYILGFVLCMLVYPLQLWHHYNAARIYSFFLFYTLTLFLFPLSGKLIVDHYFIFTGIASAFLVFPRNQKKLMIAMIILGGICYFAVWVLYEYVTPLYQVSPSAVSRRNWIILINIFIIFFIFMMSGRSFTERTENNLIKEHEKLAEMTTLLKKMFGRYLSTEVMNSLIDNPSALELGGAKKRVAMLMTDLRGFTALSERLKPEQVVHMLNAYFEVMGEVVRKYNGSINEIIGDGLLIIFGAPQPVPDQAQRAVACALAMQNAMIQVNQENFEHGLPELEMGIGVNQDEVIVGNIGSSTRSKYTVVGSGVNMTSRIESYTAGGQIFVSESIRNELRDLLRIDSEKEVLPKGAETPIRIYEIGGLAGRYNLTLQDEDPDLLTLKRQIPLRYTVLDGKHVGQEGLEGSIIRLSKKSAEIELEQAVDDLTNLKMNLSDVEADLIDRDFYGKIIQSSAKSQTTHTLRFTAVPPEISTYFLSHRQHAAMLT